MLYSPCPSHSPSQGKPIDRLANRKGRKGSHENPEAVQDVPAHVIPIIEREFDDFDTEAAKFQRGETAEEKFVGFRLKQGVYGQRQADVHMIRVKLPFGGVNAEQLEAFAELAERYTPLNKGHITTRQNLQFHHIPLEDAAKGLGDLLGEIAKSSSSAFGQLFAGVGGDALGSAISGAIGIGLTALTTKTSGDVRRRETRGAGITETREVRGVVAGPRNISIAETGDQIRDAFVETNRIARDQVAILERIDASLRGTRVGGQAPPPPGMATAAELLATQTSALGG
ncbi:hypothetical protein LCGC14_2004090 [marine sediment metagenome]|uniref:Nitrite/Sulfite reductase ferredoxin-like domain-containing protein n=1 Tax=marine sediment metagenome TaxID=412755 RepID=A0A0F9FQ14_9ZZZZ